MNKPVRTYDDAEAGIVKRAMRRKEEMRQWYILWEELAHYFHHTRKGFLIQDTPGTELQEDIWNSAPEDYRRRMSESLVSAMCPKDRYWVGMMPARTELMESDAVRLWCEVAAYRMYLVLYDPRVNFIERMNELADDTGALHTGVIYVDLDRVNKHISMSVTHLKNFWWESDVNGEVTREYCMWCMTIDDMVERFGLDSLPSEMRDEYTKPNCDATKTYEVLHAMLPNTDAQRFGMAPGRLPIRSIWILVKGSHKLAEGGYYDFPYVVVRWHRRSGEAPGRGPAMTALADARLLQAVSSALLEITEKQGNPPMQGPIDILRGEVELFPGGFTAFDASGFQFQGDPLRPVQLGANPAMTAEYLQYLEKKIGKIFFNDILSMPDDGKMTPEDQLARAQMKAAMVGPVYGRVENEMLPPILDRVFNIMMRNRALPPIPEELVGERLVYKFDNQISDMREMNEINRSLQSIAQVLQFEQPESVENLDWDYMSRDIWIKSRVPTRYMLPPDVVAANRQQREQMQQMAQMAEIAKAGGPGVQKAVEGAVQARDQGLVPAQ